MPAGATGRAEARVPADGGDSLSTGRTEERRHDDETDDRRGCGATCRDSRLGQRTGEDRPLKTETITVSVEAVDYTNRQVTVKKPDGNHDVFYVPEAIKRFDTVKVGDKITAKYYENVVLQVKRAGEKDIDKTSGGVVRSEDKTGWNRFASARHHRDDHRTGSERAVDHVFRAEGLDLQQSGRRQESAGNREGGRQGRHHVDRGHGAVARVREVSETSEDRRGTRRPMGTRRIDGGSVRRGPRRREVLELRVEIRG